ncbi:hypothetical protein BSKO_05044 [Bryopsis sp. KO-2023]|nr:hypothetical protein BSKO_05044 [Bryopsis sp. KO-2023]
MDEISVSLMACSHARPDTLAYWPQTFSLGDSVDKEWVRFWKVQRAEERRTEEGKAIAMAGADQNGLRELDGDLMDVDATCLPTTAPTRKRNVHHIDAWNAHSKRQRIDCK